MTKGKCFSAVNRGQRNKSDFYQTPHSMTEQLLENEKFDYNKTILEPCFGKYAIVKQLAEHFYNTIFMMDKFVDGADFLADSNCLKTSYIITNPPFSLAFEFIQKSKEVVTEKFAMLLPLSYLHGQKRYESGIFTDPNYPLTKVYVFTRYPLLTDAIREDGKYNTGMIAYAWYIWRKNFYGCPECCGGNFPTINWINNQKYILKKGEK